MTPRGSKSPAYRLGFYGSLTERERAEVCLGAILTQSTSWGNVEIALQHLHQAGIWDLAAVAAVPRGRLEALVRSSGYFRQKSRKLRLFAGHWLGLRVSLRSWLSGPLETLRCELLGLWGIGPETADSILLYAGGRAVFVVDAYTRRIGQRLGWFDSSAYQAVQSYFIERLPKSPRLYAEFHALLVALAKSHCLKNPRCAGCPLLGICRYGRGALKAL